MARVGASRIEVIVRMWSEKRLGNTLYKGSNYNLARDRGAFRETSQASGPAVMRRHFSTDMVHSSNPVTALPSRRLASVTAGLNVDRQKQIVGLTGILKREFFIHQRRGLSSR